MSTTSSPPPVPQSSQTSSGKFVHFFVSAALIIFGVILLGVDGINMITDRACGGSSCGSHGLIGLIGLGMMAYGANRTRKK